MSQPPEPTELIYLPSGSAMPALVAAGIAAVVIGLFTWWPYAAVGGLMALAGLFVWLRVNRAEIERMPRTQHADTAPIPLASLRRD